MKPIVTIFALITAASGWFYLFYSQAARRLASLEQNSSNRRRGRLRQINGFAMMLLAVLFFAGFYTVDFEATPMRYVAVWISVMIVLLVIVILAIVDLRLTMQLRRQLERGREKPF